MVILVSEFDRFSLPNTCFSFVVLHRNVKKEEAKEVDAAPVGF